MVFGRRRKKKAADGSESKPTRRRKTSNKEERRDDYTVYYPHTLDPIHRLQLDPIRIISIDPGEKNYALRIEDRYQNGQIKPIVFQKVNIGG